MTLTTRTAFLFGIGLAVLFYCLGLLTCNSVWKGKVPVRDTTIAVPQKEIVNKYHDTGSIKIVSRTIPPIPFDTNSFTVRLLNEWESSIGSATKDSAVTLANNRYISVIDSLLTENRLFSQILNTETNYIDTNYFPHARTVTEIQVSKNSLQRARTSLLDSNVQNIYKLPIPSILKIKTYLGGSIAYVNQTGVSFIGASFDVLLPNEHLIGIKLMTSGKGQVLTSGSISFPLSKK